MSRPFKTFVAALALAAAPASAGMGAARLLDPGTIIAPEDLVDLPGAPGAPASKLVGRETARRIMPGRPLTDYDVRSPRAVRRGQAVTVVYREAGLEITAPGTALNDAGVNEPLRVSTGHRTIEAMAGADGRAIVGDKQ